MTDRAAWEPSPGDRFEPPLDLTARAHLEALDRLLAAGTISPEEHESERERTLAFASAAATAAGGGGRSRPTRARWLLGALAGVAVVAVLLGVGLFAAGGGESDGGQAEADEKEYTASIAGPLDRLSRSAVVVGRSLADVSEPGEVRQVNRLAERQLDVVEASRRALAETPVAPGERVAHRVLVRAAAGQREYLVALARAASDDPTSSSLAAVNRARRAGGGVVSGYRAFFALVPSAPDVITGSDLADTSGLRAALIRSLEAREERAAEQARESASRATRRGSIGPATSASAEADRIFAAIRGGDYSNLAAAERLYGQLQSTTDPLRGNAAFNVGVLRYATGNCAGAAEAFRTATLVSGTAAQNTIRLRALARAQEGCVVPAATLID